MSCESCLRQERNKLIADMYLSGKSLREVGWEFGLTSTSISTILKKENVKPRFVVAKVVPCSMCSCPVDKNNGYPYLRKPICFVCSKEKRNKWASKLVLDFCVRCKKDTSKHTGKGICRNCRNDDVYKNKVVRQSKINNAIKWNKRNQVALNMYAMIKHLAKKDNMWV